MLAKVPRNPSDLEKLLESGPQNEATVLDFFSADRPHGIHAFWSRKEPRNHPLGLGKIQWNVNTHIKTIQ